MLIATRYTFKGDRSPDSVKALLAVFAEQGPGEGEIAHYVLADGRGGFTISEVESVQEAYEGSLRFAQWMDLEMTPIQTIDDAMQVVGKVYG